MPTTAQISELRRFVEDGVLVASTDVRALWRSLSKEDLRLLTDELLEAVPQILYAYGDVTASLSADWYDEVRPASVQRFRADLAPPLPIAQIEAMIRWAVGPAWQALDWDSALVNLLAGSSRLVRDPSRATIERNSARDPAAGSYVRVARSDACPFCLMLASRGAVYASKASATTTGAGGRQRGSQDPGKSFHDHCRCTPSPVFTPDDVPDFNRALSAEWKSVTSGLSGDAAFRAWSEHFSLTRT